MKSTDFFRSAILILMATFSSFGWSQEKVKPFIPDSTQYQIIETKDGADWTGRIVGVEPDTIRFETRFGTLIIPRIEILKIETLSVETVHAGQYWFANPNATRLFFAPTARMLKKGEGYFADYYIFFPSVTFGITDHFTLGGGLSLIPGANIDNQLLFITPKMGWSISPKMDAAAGLLYIQLPESHSLGIAYGVTTFGSMDRSFTTGLGYGYVDGKLAKRPVFMLGGESRTSKHIGLVTENWFGADMDGVVLSAGIRFFSRNLSVDLALAKFLGGDDDSPVIPYLDFVYKF